MSCCVHHTAAGARGPTDGPGTRQCCCSTGRGSRRTCWSPAQRTCGADTVRCWPRPGTLVRTRAATRSRHRNAGPAQAISHGVCCCCWAYCCPCGAASPPSPLMPSATAPTARCAMALPVPKAMPCATVPIRPPIMPPPCCCWAGAGAAGRRAGGGGRLGMLVHRGTRGPSSGGRRTGGRSARWRSVGRGGVTQCRNIYMTPP